MAFPDPRHLAGRGALRLARRGRPGGAGGRRQRSELRGRARLLARPGGLVGPAAPHPRWPGASATTSTRPATTAPPDPTALSGWRQRWRQIVQPRGLDAPPAASPYPPTQYAHLYWWNRDRGPARDLLLVLLPLQRMGEPPRGRLGAHPGDPARAPRGWSAGATFVPGGPSVLLSRPLQRARAARASGRPRSGARSRARITRWSTWAARAASWPGRASSAAAAIRCPRATRRRDRGWAPSAPTRRSPPPARFIAAHEFRVILLPEPDRLDARRSPELSWLRLPFYAGQRSVHTNPPGYRVLGRTGRRCSPPPGRPGWRRRVRSPGGAGSSPGLARPTGIPGPRPGTAPPGPRPGRACRCSGGPRQRRRDHRHSAAGVD